MYQDNGKYGKKLKRMAALFLAFLLMFSITNIGGSPALASGSSAASIDRADKLASLHLFNGTGVNADGTLIYNLDGASTRIHGLIMLLRLMGKEEEALNFHGSTPFIDLYDGITKYVAYAYHNGITNGTSSNTFSPRDSLTGKAYIAFLLRALGYTEEHKDFAWGEQMDFAVSLSMITRESAAILDRITLNRGDMVDLSYAALTCRMKNQTYTLAEKLRNDGIFTTQEGEHANVLGNGAKWTYSYAAYDNSKVNYEKKSVSTSQGTVTAHVLTVNTINPSVKVKSAMVDNKVGHTAPFSDIVKRSGGAIAVINGNFFSSYSAFKAPIGHVMVNGEFLYGNSGISSLGIKRDGTLCVGRPSVFIRLRSDANEWSIYEVNTNEQEAIGSVLYTPAYGNQVTMQNAGWALIVEENTIKQYYSISAGAVVTIPQNGYVVYMGSGYTSTNYFKIPQIGSSISKEAYLRVEDEEGFTLENTESIISGAPRLVRDGAIVTTLEAGFTEARFTTQSSPRTAIGVNNAGKLLLVSVPGGATIQQMRELMLKLNCVDAFNLDGGASCGMYYHGSYLSSPARNLTVTLQVFVND